MAVFIIPGFFSKKEYYSKLADRLKKENLKVEILDLGRNLSNLEVASKKVLQRLEKTPEKDDIIAHSFGGVILKHILAKKPEIKKQIKSIHFISVPHGGTWSALLMLIFPAARDMLPTKKHFKQAVDISFDNIVNFVSEKDIKIWPKKASRLKEHIDVVISGTSHDNIIKSEELFSKIIAFIKSK